MKNQLLTPVLLPTKDATNIFFIDVFGKELGYNEKLIPNGNKNQHIYLCSDAPTKEGYCLSPDNTVCKVIGYDTDINKYYVFIRGAKCFIEKDYKKIEFASDPKLTKCDGKCAKNECVCTLVPTIDGNTKARVKYYTFGDVPSFKEVNFLTELCKGWNEKNHKGLDLDKISSKASELISKITKKDYEDFVKKDNQKVDVEKLAKETYPDEMFVDEKVIGALRRAFIKGYNYNQALQSQAGGFGDADIVKAYQVGQDYNADLLTSTYQNRPKDGKEYLQSLTKETPKGEIVIELNEGKLIFR